MQLWAFLPAKKNMEKNKCDLHSETNTGNTLQSEGPSSSNKGIYCLCSFKLVIA